MKKPERKKERKRHISTYGNILPTYGKNGLVFYCYSTITLLQLDFKNLVCHMYKYSETSINCFRG